MKKLFFLILLALIIYANNIFSMVQCICKNGTSKNQTCYHCDCDCKSFCIDKGGLAKCIEVNVGPGKTKN